MCFTSQFRNCFVSKAGVFIALTEVLYVELRLISEVQIVIQAFQCAVLAMVATSLRRGQNMIAADS